VGSTAIADDLLHTAIADTEYIDAVGRFKCFAITVFYLGQDDAQDPRAIFDGVHGVLDFFAIGLEKFGKFAPLPVRTDIIGYDEHDAPYNS